MAESGNHELTLAVSGSKVILKDWITGADDARIQEHYYNGSITEAGRITYRPGTMQAADHEALKAVIVSIDGSTDDIVTRVMNLPLADVRQVTAEVKKITDPLVSSDATVSDGTTPAI